jgi:hypothetical protein
MKTPAKSTVLPNVSVKYFWFMLKGMISLISRIKNHIVQEAESCEEVRIWGNMEEVQISNLGGGVSEKRRLLNR